MTVRTDILPEDLTEEQTVIVHNIIQDYADGLPSDRGTGVLPFGSRVRQPRPAKDVEGFFTLVKRCLEDKQNSEAIASDLRLNFLEEHPPEEIETETISFKLRSREPASFSQGKALNQRVQEMKPHIRSIESDPTQPGHKIITLGQQFENVVELTCWAKTNKQANYRARWLEDTLREYAWYIKYEGVMEFFFQSQENDMVLEVDSTSNTLKGRPLLYYVRTERLTHILEPTIRRIVVEYGLGEHSSTEQ
jgi:hypothetical protein